MTYHIQEKSYVNDVYLYRLLWESKKLDQKVLIKDVEQSYFDLILIPRKVTLTLKEVPSLSPIALAVADHYDIEKKDNYFFYCLPKKKGQASVVK